MPISSNPLVSIGIPTFNRAASLRRSVLSVLKQDYSNIEILISDNASVDETPDVCQVLCLADNRIKYMRQSHNMGACENFNQVLNDATGEFFMWLGDDDWLDPSYVSQCAAFLLNSPAFSLVAGKALYFQGEAIIYEGKSINLLNVSGKERVIDYFEIVTDNGVFYGVARREFLLNTHLQNTIAGDWLLVGHLAFLGKVKTLENVFVNRLLGGTSSSMPNLIEAYGMKGFLARNPYLKIALNILTDIIWNSEIYRPSGRIGRLWLGLSTFFAILNRFCIPLWKQDTKQWIKSLIKKILRIKYI